MTDPYSRIIARTGRVPVQGYNAQAIATEGQILLAAGLTQQSNDSGQLEPMVRQALCTLKAAGIETSVGTVLADAANWNSPQISALGRDGITAIVPLKRRIEPRRASSPRAKDPRLSGSKRCSRLPRARRSYRRRQQIEPVFANTKFIRRITRFHRRGLAACRAEWRLVTATHNLWA